MRLWSIHPRYLDAKGLTACWREALLAKAVVAGRTKGYRHHPQLHRFGQGLTAQKKLIAYLYFIYQEALTRGYKYDARKLHGCPKNKRHLLKINSGQLNYEFEHLQKKLRQRAPLKYRENRQVRRIEPHPLFVKQKGEVEKWEKLSRAVNK